MEQSAAPPATASSPASSICTATASASSAPTAAPIARTTSSSRPTRSTAPCRATRCSSTKRRRGRDGRRSGRIARVLTRRNPTVVGIFHYARAASPQPTWENMPLHPRQLRHSPRRAHDRSPSSSPTATSSPPPRSRPPPRPRRRSAASSSTGRTTRSRPPAPLEGLAVDVEITDFPTARSPRPRPRHRGPRPARRLRRRRRDHHPQAPSPAHLPRQRPRRSQRLRQQTVDTLAPEELAPRRDFRGLPIVTIDGETARDFDDAVLVAELPNGNCSCRCTSPTSATTSRPAPRSTSKPACAAPASTSPTAPSPCCRRSFRRHVQPAPRTKTASS